MKRLRKIVIVGEIWSPNLGDGIIADSLSFLLKQVQSDVQVSLLDISGRDSISAPPSGKLLPAKKLVRSKMWSRMLVNVLRWRIRERRFLPVWSTTLSDADVVIIGGGQLLMDNALDFPVKVSAVSRLSRSLGKPTHFVSCGVGSKWSFGASRLFRKALKSSSSISVRDTLSVERLESFVPGAPVSLSSDPALWTADVYKKNYQSGNDLVGLGIMNVDLINRHTNLNLSVDDLVEFWVGLGSKLHTRGVNFEFFTNGSPDDYEVAQQVFHAIHDQRAIPCTLARRPTTACELALNISQYKAILASRLHAHVVATSYHIPSIALVWDDKVRTFFRDTGREDLAFDGFKLDLTDRLVSSLGDIMDEQVSQEMVEEKRSLVLEDLRHILAPN